MEHKDNVERCDCFNCQRDRFHEIHNKAGIIDGICGDTPIYNYIEKETQKYKVEIDKAFLDLIVYGNAGVQIITNENGEVIVKNIDLNSEEAMQELADEAQRLGLSYTDETYEMQLKGESEND